jgi:F-type H+-transporting ATPase subunit b
MKRLSRLKRLSWVATGLLTAIASLNAQEGGAQKEPGIGWKWANFAILVVGLGYLMAKTLPPLFKARTAEIQKGIAEAQKIKQEAEQRAAAVEAKTRALGADIERFRGESKIEMQQEAERIRQETAAQITRLEQKAGQEIEAAGKTARRELKSYAAKLALDLAEQRVRTRLDANTEQALVDGFIHDLERESKN